MQTGPSISPMRVLARTTSSFVLLAIFVGFSGFSDTPLSHKPAEKRPFVSSGSETLSTEIRCDVDAKFLRAEPVEIRSKWHPQEKGESISGVGGRYRISTASTSADLKFNHVYVSEYARKVEDYLVTLAGHELCETGNAPIKIQVTFIELEVFQLFDLAQLPVYGRVNYDAAKSLLSGVFVWNPRQIFADQYWLHTDKLAPEQSRQITPELFAKSADTYHKFLESRGPEQSRSELEGIPDDLLWLFGISSQSTRAHFMNFARGKLDSLISASEPGYSALAIELIRFQLKSGASSVEPSLKDLGQSELIEIYKYPTTK